MYDLTSPFDLELHKKTFVNYLEVVIFPDGHVEYAIPSHQEKLIKVACDLNGWSRDQLNKKCPREYYFDFMTWLCNVTGCVSIWDNYKVISDTIPLTDEQLRAITLLKKGGVYHGE